MELIKKIKEAEAKAQQIIAGAKTDSVNAVEQWDKQKRQLLAKAEQDRTKAIAQAVEAAQKQAQADIEQLKAKAVKDRQELAKTTAAKMDAAVNKVVNYIKG